MTSKKRVRMTLAHLAILGFISALSSPAFSQSVNDTSEWSEDQEIDRVLGALTGPILQPIGFSGMDLRIIPDSARYKQQPDSAQRDFRPPPPEPEIDRRPDRTETPTTPRPVATASTTQQPTPVEPVATAPQDNGNTQNGNGQNGNGDTQMDMNPPQQCPITFFDPTCI